MPWAVWRLTFNESLSVSGMNPLGTMPNISTVANSTPTNTTSMSQAVPKHQSQAPTVARAQPIERAVHEPGKPALGADDTQKAAAEHRRERDRDEAGDEHGGRNRDGKFAEEPAEYAAHEQEAG